MRLQTTKQLKNNTNIETLQPTKTNDNCKVSKNGHTTNEDKNKQIHSQIKIQKGEDTPGNISFRLFHETQFNA